MTDGTADIPTEITVIAEPVHARLTTFLDTVLAEWAAVDADVAAPLDAIRRLVLAGGKRLRPAFCYWGFVGAGGSTDDPVVVDAGAAFELLHAFALVHDDVMDGSTTRRGAPAVHVEFAERHRADGWTGEPRRFGEGVAILAGDLAHVLANQLTDRFDRTSRALWHQLAIEVNIGQYLDVLGTARGAVDLDTARRISRLKSGKYTIERPLHVGVTLAGRPDLVDALSGYGEPVGEAFQLRDDLLGAFGQPGLTGKPVGDDLREGKPTPLLAMARQRCTGADVALLDRVGAPDLAEHEVDALRDLLDSCGARAAVEQHITALTERALDALDDLDDQELDQRARSALVVLATYVGTRDR